MTTQVLTKEDAEALYKRIVEIIDSKVNPVLDRTLALLEAAVDQNVELQARIKELEAKRSANPAPLERPAKTPTP